MNFKDECHSLYKELREAEANDSLESVVGVVEDLIYIVERLHLCSNCDGSGKSNENHLNVCKNCRGKGAI
jgi:DnaJ-class molecular chaperone